MVQERLFVAKMAIADISPRSTAVAMYLQDIAHPQATNVVSAIGKFIEHCSKYQLSFDEIEYGLNEKILIDHLIYWCQCQSDARYMIIRQAILDIIGNNPVEYKHLISAVAIASDLDGSLDFLQD